MIVKWFLKGENPELYEELSDLGFDPVYVRNGTIVESEHWPSKESPFELPKMFWQKAEVRLIASEWHFTEHEFTEDEYVEVQVVCGKQGSALIPYSFGQGENKAHAFFSVPGTVATVQARLERENRLGIVIEEHQLALQNGFAWIVTEPIFTWQGQLDARIRGYQAKYNAAMKAAINKVVEEKEFEAFYYALR